MKYSETLCKGLIIIYHQLGSEMFKVKLDKIRLASRISLSAELFQLAC